jgi:hypothetical protein
MSSAASSSSATAAATTSDAAAVERKLKRMRETATELQQQGAEVLAEIEKVDTAHK